MAINHSFFFSFDDSGRQYDAKGSLTPWWPQPVVDAFNAQAKCMIDQYSAITLVESQATVNGLLTLGENIADNGGVREAYSAFQAQMNSMDKHDREDEIDTIEERFGMSPEQLFFVSFAQIWCEKSRPVRSHFIFPSLPGSLILVSS
jgi:endothelin-converting enzyme